MEKFSLLILLEKSLEQLLQELSLEEKLQKDLEKMSGCDIEIDCIIESFQTHSFQIRNTSRFKYLCEQITMVREQIAKVRLEIEFLSLPIPAPDLPGDIFVDISSDFEMSDSDSDSDCEIDEETLRFVGEIHKGVQGDITDTVIEMTV